MEPLRHLPDVELNVLFGTLSSSEFGEEDLAALLQGYPGKMFRRIGHKRARRIFLELVRDLVSTAMRR
jgi:hypothetical protein